MAAGKKKGRKVRTAVIPAAGLGTRQLPASKSIPKEMLQVYDRPALQWVVEEAVQSGMDRILIITSKGKESMADHFDKHPELERALADKKKAALLKKMMDLSSMADIHFVRQKEAKGLGHAVLQAEDYVGDETFAVLLPDDLYFCKPPGIGQLARVHEKLGGAVVSVRRYAPKDLLGYGVPTLGRWADKLTVQLKDLEEKPPLDKQKSDLGVIGRYILPAEIFSVLKKTKPGALGEIQLTDAIKAMARKGLVWGHLFRGERFDAGSPAGLMEAALYAAWQEKDSREKLRPVLERLLADAR